MAFNRDLLSLVQWDANNAIWKYPTPDALTTILADGYFDTATSGRNPIPLRVRDVIIVTPENGVYGGTVFVGINTANIGDVATKYLNWDSRLVYLADYYRGENYWDDAFGRALAANGTALGDPYSWTVLPVSSSTSTQGKVRAEVQFSEPWQLFNARKIMGSGSQIGSRIGFNDIDPSSLGCITFGGDPTFVHEIRLMGFYILGMPQGVHGIYQNILRGEYSYFDDLTIGPANNYLEGTAVAGGATTITLAADASSVDDAYNGKTIYITNGTGSGQSKTITDYDGGDQQATVSAWTTQPDTTSTYRIENATDASLASDGYHLPGISQGSTPFRNGQMTFWRCRYGLNMNGVQNLTSVHFGAVHGDFNQYLINIEGGFGSGGVCIDNIKHEMNGGSLPTVTGNCLGTLRVKDTRVPIKINQLKYHDGTGTNNRTTGVVEIQNTEAGIETSKSIVDIKQIFPTHGLPFLGTDAWPIVVNFSYLDGGNSGLTRSLSRDDVLRIYGEDDVEHFRPPSIGYQAFDFDISRADEHELIRDDFRGLVAPESAYWERIVGTDPACIAATPVLDDLRGVLLMATGSDGGLTPDLNGSMLTWTALAWTPTAYNDPYPGGSLDIWWRLKRLAGEPRLFVGLTDQLASGGIIAPYTATAGTVADAASITNGVGFLVDPGATAGADTWLLVSTNDGTVTQSAAEVTASNAIYAASHFGLIERYQTLRVSIPWYSIQDGLPGDALFYIDNNYVGKIAAAIDPTASLTPCIAIDASAASSASIHIDWFRGRVQSNRQV